jgi:hypothetical protein
VNWPLALSPHAKSFPDSVRAVEKDPPHLICVIFSVVNFGRITGESSYLET